MDIEGGELEAMRQARAEGYAEGLVAGRRQVAEEMLIRLKQMGIDLVAQEHRGAGPEALAGNAAGVGALPMARLMSPATPVSPRAAPATSRRQPKPKRARKPRGNAGRQAWKTPEREAELRRLWPVLSFRDIGRRLAEMDGAPFPQAASQAVYAWSRQLDLPRRTEGQSRDLRFRAITARRASVGLSAAVFTTGARVTWSEALAWTATRAPDLVLRGSRAERLAQINAVRRAEGVGPFTLHEPRQVAAA